MATYFKRKDGRVAIAQRPADEVRLRNNGGVKLPNAAGEKAYRAQFETAKPVDDAPKPVDAPKPGPAGGK